MVYLRGALVGVATGLVAAALWAAGNLYLPLLYQTIRSQAEGGYLGSASVDSTSTLLVIALGFGAGFYWTVRSPSGLKTRRS